MSYPPTSYILKPRNKLKFPSKSKLDEEHCVETKKFILPQKIYAIKRSNSVEVPAGEAYTLYVATPSQLGILANNIVFLDNELRPIQIVHKDYNPPPVTNAFHKHRTQEIGLEKGNVTEILYKPQVPLRPSTSSIFESVHQEGSNKGSTQEFQSNRPSSISVHSVPTSNSSVHNATSSLPLQSGSSSRHRSRSSIRRRSGTSVPHRSRNSVRHRSGSETFCSNGVQMKCCHCDQKPDVEILLAPQLGTKRSKRSNKKPRAHFASDVDLKCSQVTVSSTSSLGTGMDYSRELCAFSPSWSPYGRLEDKTSTVANVSHITSSLPHKASLFSSFTSHLGSVDTEDDSCISNTGTINDEYSTYRTCCRHQTTSCHCSASEPSDKTATCTCHTRRDSSPFSKYATDSRSGFITPRIRSYGSNLLSRFKSCCKQKSKPKCNTPKEHSCKSGCKCAEMKKKPSVATCSSSSTYTISTLSRMKSKHPPCSDSPSNSSLTSSSTSSSEYSLSLTHHVPSSSSSSSSSYSESDSSTQSDPKISRKPIRICRTNCNGGYKTYYSHQNSKKYHH